MGRQRRRHRLKPDIGPIYEYIMPSSFLFSFLPNALKDEKMCFAIRGLQKLISLFPAPWPIIPSFRSWKKEWVFKNSYKFARSSLVDNTTCRAHRSPVLCSISLSVLTRNCSMTNTFRYISGSPQTGGCSPLRWGVLMILASDRLTYSKCWWRWVESIRRRRRRSRRQMTSCSVLSFPVRLLIR